MGGAGTREKGVVLMVARGRGRGIAMNKSEDDAT